MDLSPDYRSGESAQKEAACSIFAPGRINLLGEHTDYNGGKVLPFAINLGIRLSLAHSGGFGSRKTMRYHFVARQRQETLSLSYSELDGLLAQYSGENSSKDFRFLLPSGWAHSWVRYVMGALLRHHHLRQQLGQDEPVAQVQSIEIDSNLPIGAGISSSAALCTGLLSLLATEDQLDRTADAIALDAMYIEHQFAGTRCGLMDQSVIVSAKPGQLLCLDFVRLHDEGRLLKQFITPHSNFSDYHPVLLNTRVKHELGSSPYNERRQSCELGLQILNAKTARAHDSLGAYAADLDFIKEYCPDYDQANLIVALTNKVFVEKPQLSSRIAHAILETCRVTRAVEALENGDLELLSELINASHVSLRDDYEVSCFELDLIRELALKTAQDLHAERSLRQPAILGARMTGGGFGGATIQLVHSSILEEFVRRVEAPDSPYVRATGLKPEAMITDFCAGLRPAFG